MISRKASTAGPLRPASTSMNFSRWVPWKSDPPIRTKKKRRTSGSCQCSANVVYAAGSVGQSPNGAAKNSRNRVIGKRNAVMNPPAENRLQSSGSRKTSGSSVSPSAWTVSRPGFHASDSRVPPISSAVSDPSED
jgi:hypothetical protein